MCDLPVDDSRCGTPPLSVHSSLGPGRSAAMLRHCGTAPRSMGATNRMPTQEGNVLIINRSLIQPLQLIRPPGPLTGDPAMWHPIQRRGCIPTAGCSNVPLLTTQAQCIPLVLETIVW
ncbi:hypothetical protein NDU88_005404 [Pleurodeles waltl]|uniref:Uncharacterized protein n=1 Tax=Pleurodeles waltl TaxID=8319 RepID=A0AAV7WYN9_PLEWA|nr:hypothetical protein NDU88_005404 [Pleurodeles waltl]